MSLVIREKLIKTTIYHPGTIRLEKLKSMRSSVSKKMKANSPQTLLEGSINS